MPTWQEKIAYVYTYVTDEEKREDLIHELGKSLM